VSEDATVDGMAPQVQEFIVKKVDSVAQLEALLLLRAGVGRTWHAAAVAQRLYIQPATAASLLRGLHERELTCWPV
jgi:hypothetical protein